MGIFLAPVQVALSGESAVSLPLNLDRAPRPQGCFAFQLPLVVTLQASSRQEVAMSFMEKVARIRAELLGEGCEMPIWVLLEPVEPAAGPVLEVPPESAGGSGDS